MNQTMHELGSKYRAINMNGIKDIQELKHHISQHSPLMLASFMCRSKLSFKNSILGLSQGFCVYIIFIDNIKKI